MLSPEHIVDTLIAEGLLDISKERNDVTVNTVADGAIYRLGFTFDSTDIDVEVTSGVGDSALNILTNLQTALNANGIIASLVDDSLVAGPVLRLDAKVTGDAAWTAFSVSSNLSVVTSAPVDPVIKAEIVGRYSVVVGGAVSVAINPLTTQLDDYAFAGGTGDDYAAASFWSMSVDTPLTVTGFESSPGPAAGTSFRQVVLVNSGTAEITLSEENVASAATNRIRNSGGASSTVPPGAAASLIYDIFLERWRVEDIEAGVGGGGEIVGVSAGDGSPGFLTQKLTSGANIVLTTLNAGGDEDLQIALTGTSAGFDTTAIHDDTSGEIAGVVAKAAPTASDLLLIEDAAAANAKKSITLGAIPHGSLSDTGTNTHAQIDTHIGDATVHFTEASIDHGSILGLGDDDHPQYLTEVRHDALPSDNPHGVTAAQAGALPVGASHTALTDIGTNTHAQIDSHIADAAIHIDWTAPGAGTIDTSNYIEGGPGTDTTAIHDNTAGEISLIAAKATPTSADFLLIEDAAAANAKKRITIGGIPHNSLSGTGTNTHTQIDSHIADATIHFTEASIDHTAIANIGTNTHAQIDSHITTANIHIDWTAASAGTIDTSNYIEGGPGTDTTAIHDNVAGEISVVTAKATPTTSDFLLIEDAAAANAKKRITIGAIDHDSLTNVGTNTHAQIDTHIADGTIHFTEASIDHTAITNIGTNTHAQIDSHIATAAIHIDWTAPGAGTIDTSNYIEGGPSTDTTAIHDNTAGEISLITAKAVPTNADYLLIEDAAAANAKKRITLGDLPANNLTWANTIDNQPGIGEPTKDTQLGLLNSDFILWGDLDYVQPTQIFYASDGTVGQGGTVFGSAAHLIDFQFAQGDFLFGDGNKGASTYAGQFKLTGATAEWSTFETNFGEVSLLDAINQNATAASNNTDPNAIHDNVSGEIAAITAKALPTTADILLIEDAAAGNAKKSIIIGDLPVSLQQAVDNQVGAVSIGAKDLDWVLTDGQDFTVFDPGNSAKALFRVIAGAGGDTISFNTDNFDVTNASTAEFSNTIRVGGASGTFMSASQITIGGAGLLNTASLNNLSVQGAGDLALASLNGSMTLSDSFKSGSSFFSPLTLADSSAEWSDFETNFGEVSLLNAINQNAAAVGVTTLQEAVDNQVGAVSIGAKDLDWVLTDGQDFTIFDPAGPAKALFRVAAAVAGDTVSMNVADLTITNTNNATFSGGIVVDNAGNGITIDGGAIEGATSLAVQTSGVGGLTITAINGPITLEDQYRAGTGYASEMPFSNSKNEWDLFAEYFGPTASLLNAINQAAVVSEGFTERGVGVVEGMWLPVFLSDTAISGEEVFYFIWDIDWPTARSIDFLVELPLGQGGSEAFRVQDISNGATIAQITPAAAALGVATDTTLTNIPTTGSPICRVEFFSEGGPGIIRGLKINFKSS